MYLPVYRRFICACHGGGKQIRDGLKDRTSETTDDASAMRYQALTDLPYIDRLHGGICGVLGHRSHSLSLRCRSRSQIAYQIDRRRMEVSGSLSMCRRSQFEAKYRSKYHLGLRLLG